MTLSMIGGHFRSNGLGAGYPSRACLSIQGNGLDEQHPDTIVLFRDVTVYNDGPPDLHTHELRRQMPFAQYWYDQLRPIWLANKHRADYFTITNEIGGSDPEHIKDHIAFESNICQLAAADGLKCAVGKLAGDSPNWPSNLWQQYYVPFIVEMAETFGAIYARHVYGGNLVDGNGNPTHDQPGSPARAIQEADILRSVEYTGGIVLAECGLDGGYGVADYGRFQQQATGYAAALKPYADIIIGLCWWDCGDTPDFRADYTGHLKQIRPVLDTSLPKWEPGTVDPPDPPTPPTGNYKSVVFKLAQEHDEEAWVTAARQAYQEYKRTMTASGDNVRVMVGDGNAESYAVIFDHEYPSQQETIHILESAGLNYVTRPLNPPPAPGFTFTHWPTNDKRVTQRFLANPANYRPFGLPGHDGIDIAAATGSPITAVASGTIAQINTNPGASNYGIYIRVAHADNYETTYAHLQSIQAGLVVGTAVQGGQVLGKADSTGNSFGSHLHLTLKEKNVTFTDKCGEAWPYNICDPEPFMMHFEGVTWPGVVTCPAPPGVTYDISTYLIGKTDGRATQMNNGETFQYQAAGDNIRYLVKNSQYEQFYVDNEYIWRGIDTSPGPAPDYAERPGALRYYTQKEQGKAYARWCPRYMTVGQVWVGAGHHVQFAYKADCVNSAANSGGATNRLTFVAHHPSKTWGAITMQDVIEILNGTGETFWCAYGWGMVAWSSQWGESHVTELFQPGQRTLTREAGCFS